MKLKCFFFKKNSEQKNFQATKNKNHFGVSTSKSSQPISSKNRNNDNVFKKIFETESKKHSQLPSEKESLKNPFETRQTKIIKPTKKQNFASDKIEKDNLSNFLPVPSNEINPRTIVEDFLKEKRESLYKDELLRNINAKTSARHLTSNEYLDSEKFAVLLEEELVKCYFRENSPAQIHINAYNEFIYYKLPAIFEKNGGMDIKTSNDRIIIRIKFFGMLTPLHWLTCIIMPMHHNF